MDDYKKYLADSIIAEDKVVTYRLLSRTLKVHVNTAKQMLYEFHKYQNDRRPGAVHATYLAYGVKRPVGQQNGADGDVEMTSSMPDSLGESVPTFTLSLIQEERLNDVLSQYDEVSSIHVYSVGPNPVKDLTLLADAALDAFSFSSPSDNKSCSSITNPRVRRRERKGSGAISAATAAKPVKQEAKPALSKPGTAAKVKEEKNAPTPETETVSSAVPAKKPPPTLKRGGSSNSGIMQAFSKAAAATKIKKEKATSQPATPSGDDSSMQPMSDDGEDDEEMPQPKPRSTAGRKTKKEREEELRRMMEELDDEEEEEEKAPTPEEEEPVEEPPAPEPVKEEPAEVISASGDGRRRGKRRVMRKKQIMDEQGYLVTIQEAGWESFSEDEAPPATKPKTANSAPAPAPVAKGKKSGPKGNQGSIMSFFSKK